jgi:drug/metabolite transporter (DMT)-like permease
MVVVAYIACALIWGTTYFAIRVSIGEGGYPTFVSAAIRFVVAAVLLWGVVGLGRARPGPRSRAEWAWCALAGVLAAGSYALVYFAEQFIPGALAAVLYGTLPLWMALLVSLTGAERPTRAALAGAVVSLGGMVVIFWERLAVSEEQTLGVALMVGSVILSATYSIILKKHAHGQHALATNAVFLSACALVMTLAAVGFEHKPLPWPPPAEPTLAVLYLAVVGSVVAFGSYFYLLKRIRLMTLSMLTLVIPCVALVVDALWESEPITGRTYAGVSVTLGGVLLNALAAAPRPA